MSTTPHPEDNTTDLLLALDGIKHRLQKFEEALTDLRQKLAVEADLQLRLKRHERVVITEEILNTQNIGDH